MEYNKKIAEARQTKKGIVIKFQEKENYKLSPKGKYDCPHCGAYHGYKMNGDKPDYSNGKEVVDRYEIPSDIIFMYKHPGYSWTKDCKCANCGKMYSCNNGC